MKDNISNEEIQEFIKNAQLIKERDEKTFYNIFYLIKGMTLAKVNKERGTVNYI